MQKSLETETNIAKISVEEIASQIKSLEKQKLAKLSEIDTKNKSDKMK